MIKYTRLSMVSTRHNDTINTLLAQTLPDNSLHDEAKRSSYVDIAKYNGTTVGVLLGDLEQVPEKDTELFIVNTTNSNKLSWLDVVAVLPDMQGAGIGGTLIKRFLSKAQYPVYLSCEDTMKEYYETFGFKEVIRYQNGNIFMLKSKE